MTTSRNFVSVDPSQHDIRWVAIRDLPGTMTISFLRVRNRRSFTSSDLSMPSVKAFASVVNVNTIRAISSALFPLSYSVLPG